MVWNWKKGKSTLRNRCKNSWGSKKVPGITDGMNCLKISACTMNTRSFTRDVQQNITSSANWVITKSHCQNAVKNCGIRFMQTAKNIARIIQKKDESKEYHHTEGTVYEYTRLRVASMFGKKIGEGGTHGEILEKFWCRADLEHNCYIPMSDEAIQKFLDCYSQSKKDGKQKELELLNDYQIGLIQKEKLQEAIGEISLSNYIAARKSFHQKYGYYPIKVPVYGLDGFDILRFEKENNTMSTIEITSKIEALKELEALIEEAKAEAEALRDEIKTEMLNRNTEEMEAGQYIVRWTPVLSQRFDSTAFKKVMPEVYKDFIKQTASRRFSIA